MLTEAKKELKIAFMSIKYAIMREMVNKVTFILNIIIMIINNATFIIQWVIVYQIRDDIGGYTFNQLLMLWGLAAGVFGFSRLFFKNAFHISDSITNGKLDSYLVQPKNALLSIITSDSDSSAIGDIIYGYILLFISGITIQKFILFTLFVIMGGIISTDIAIILGSLSFWLNKSDLIAETGNALIINFSTYPDGIFYGGVKFLLFSIIPIGFIAYIPVKILSNLNYSMILIPLAFAITMTILAFIIFYKGLKKYSSSSLMLSKI